MILPTPPEFQRVHHKGQTIWISQKALLEALLAILREFQQGGSLPEGHLLKQDRPAVVWRFKMEGRLWVLKAYCRRKLLRHLWDGLVYSRAFRCASLAVRFQSGGIATPLPLAALSADKQGGSYLVTPFLEGYQDLRQWTSTVGSETVQGTLVVRGLAKWVANMHSQGLYHGDLKTVNIFLKEEGGHLNFSAIDLDGAVRVRKFSLSRTARDLSPLMAYLSPWATRRTLLRFGLVYVKQLAKQVGMSKGRKKKLLKKTLEKIKGRQGKGKSLPPDFKVDLFD